MVGVMDRVRLVQRTLDEDQETPISLFRKLGDQAGSFLLESAEGGERVGRYSLIGWDPLLELTRQGGQVITTRAGLRRVEPTDTWSALETLLAGLRPQQLPDAAPFSGGAVGYLGYDTVNELERLPPPRSDDRELPDAWFMVPGKLVIVDHLRRTLTAVAAALQSEGEPVLRDRLEDAVRLRERPLPPQVEIAAHPRIVARVPSPARYEEMVRAAKAHIRAGDIFQVVLSQRWAVATEETALAVYRRLRGLNPSPYLFYLNQGALRLVGSSPEALVSRRGQRIILRPIAGTRPRSADPAEDARRARSLLKDEKERAEHLMLVDLARNDVGRVSRYGTVRVNRFMEVESYSHVIHLVSEVEGEARGDLGLMDPVRAAFPAGTLTGAPKIRAMQIIHELEPMRRGPYGGAVGYIAFSGDLDFAIAIRTLVMRDQMAYMQAGAGLVADSDPATEVRECEAKAKGLLQALGVQGVDPT